MTGGMLLTEKGETQSFYDEFFQVFGRRRHTVARFEHHVAKLDNSSGYIDLFWPGELIVEQKSAGRDLDRAYGQAGEYFDALPEHERPRYILVFRHTQIYGYLRVFLPPGLRCSSLCGACHTASSRLARNQKSLAATLAYLGVTEH